MGRPNKYFKVTQGLPWVLFIHSILDTSVQKCLKLQK